MWLFLTRSELCSRGAKRNNYHEFHMNYYYAKWVKIDTY